MKTSILFALLIIWYAKAAEEESGLDEEMRVLREYEFTFYEVQKIAMDDIKRAIEAAHPAEELARRAGARQSGPRVLLKLLLGHVSDRQMDAREQKCLLSVFGRELFEHGLRTVLDGEHENWEQIVAVARAEIGSHPMVDLYEGSALQFQSLVDRNCDGVPERKLSRRRQMEHNQEDVDWIVRNLDFSFDLLKVITQLVDDLRVEKIAQRQAEIVGHELGPAQLLAVYHSVEGRLAVVGELLDEAHRQEGDSKDAQRLDGTRKMFSADSELVALALRLKALEQGPNLQAEAAALVHAFGRELGRVKLHLLSTTWRGASA